MRKHWGAIKNWKLWLAAAIAAILLVAAAMWLTHRPPSTPEAGGAYETAALLKTSKQLEASFGATGSSGEITRNYIGLLNNLQAECHDITHYKSMAPLSAGTAGRLASSAALCIDLDDLVGNSKTIYSATLPVLTASPHLKRYQTLFLAGHIRSQQSAEVNTAISQLGAPLQNMEFQSQALSLLQRLQVDIKTSKGLGYYPALGTFQNALLQERAQYWLDYGQLSSLTQALQHELDGYCQALQTKSKSMQACRK